MPSFEDCNPCCRGNTMSDVRSPEQVRRGEEASRKLREAAQQMGSEAFEAAMNQNMGMEPGRAESGHGKGASQRREADGAGSASRDS